jgi:DNA-binding HxlR family transcriptional regulator
MTESSIEDTSVNAFKKILAEGDDVILRKQVAAHLGTQPMTPHEVAQQFPSRSKNSIAPRLTELIRMGCVEKDGKRQTPSGNDAYVHHLTELGERYVVGDADPEMGKTVSEHKSEVVAVARRFVRGDIADKSILRLYLEDHDKAKHREEPEWTSPLISEDTDESEQ